MYVRYVFWTSVCRLGRYSSMLLLKIVSEDKYLRTYLYVNYSDF